MSPTQIDEMPVSVLCNCIECKCISCEISFQSGVITNILKNIAISQIYKSGDQKCIKKHHPTSDLPLISKIYEKCMNFWLLGHFERHSSFSNYQYGLNPYFHTWFKFGSFLHYIWVQHVQNLNISYAILTKFGPNSLT